VVPDTHIPAADAAALNVMLGVAREWKPNGIVILGDFIDCYHLSRFSKRSGMPTQAVEIEETKHILDVFDKLGATHKWYLEGNHEKRLTDRLSEVGLDDLLSWDTLLGLPERGWKFQSYHEEPLRIGNLRFTHDMGYAGKNATQQTLDFAHCNIVHGHTHRGRIIYQGDGMGKTHMAMCPGWLGDYRSPHMSYEKNFSMMKSWTSGFGMIEMFSDGDFRAHLAPIVEAKGGRRAPEVQLPAW
jgi:UDP-2,3-diacylglucosamine pyrophosphatase LpxH